VDCIKAEGAVEELRDDVVGEETYSQRAQSGSAKPEATSMPEFAPYPW
jgi:hypothetical protein